LENYYNLHLNYLNRRLFLIYRLNLYGTYQGWRHLVGLPVHGQRTWTNSKSSYVLNSKTLREYRVLLAKTYYFRITDKNLLVLVMAEA
jgi:ribosomal protein S13